MKKWIKPEISALGVEQTLERGAGVKHVCLAEKDENKKMHDSQQNGLGKDNTCVHGHGDLKYSGYENHLVSCCNPPLS